MANDSDVDVLIVGAGPTGLTLGCELARRGVSFRLIDKAVEPHQLSKAIAIQARTLEIFEDMGIADQAVARGIRLVGAQLLAEGRPVVQASFDELDTRYPYILAIAQSETEAVLEALLTRLGGRVDRSLELTALRQDDVGVDATLRGASGDEKRVHSRYLVGADGAHSAVRKLLGLDFDGKKYEENFALADVRVDWDLPNDRITSFFSNSGLLACFPMTGGRMRLIATLPDDATGEPTLADFQRFLDERAGVRAKVSDPVWVAGFRIHCRQVKKYRDGRVFVAGDAAHIHSPAGGQGMNTGIQDAHNLAWKLALAVAGRARPELLDSYHAERHGIGAGVLSSTDFATRVATLKNPVARAIRNRLSEFLSSLEVVQQRITKSVAELTLTYRHSPIVSEHRASLLSARLGASEDAENPNLLAWRRFDLAPRPGDRVLDAMVRDGTTGQAVRLAEIANGLRHTVLLFDGRARTPDGYARFSALSRELEKRLGDVLRVAVVVSASERPAALDWSGTLLFDPEGELEERYGAEAECAYVIRPDLYVGFRSQPLEPEPLFAYFDKIFV